MFVPNGGDGTRREVPLAKLHGVLELMRELSSPECRQPGSYKDASHNASYILSLVQASEDDVEGVFVSPEGRTRLDQLTSTQQDELWEFVRRAASLGLAE